MDGACRRKMTSRMRQLFNSTQRIERSNSFSKLMHRIRNQRQRKWHNHNTFWFGKRSLSVLCGIAKILAVKCQKQLGARREWWMTWHESTAWVSLYCQTILHAMRHDTSLSLNLTSQTYSYLSLETINANNNGYLYNEIKFGNSEIRNSTPQRWRVTMARKLLLGLSILTDVRLVLLGLACSAGPACLCGETSSFNRAINATRLDYTVQIFLSFRLLGVMLR